MLQRNNVIFLFNYGSNCYYITCWIIDYKWWSLVLQICYIVSYHIPADALVLSIMLLFLTISYLFHLLSFHRSQLTFAGWGSQLTAAIWLTINLRSRFFIRLLLLIATRAVLIQNVLFIGYVTIWSSVFAFFFYDHEIFILLFGDCQSVLLSMLLRFIQFNVVWYVTLAMLLLIILLVLKFIDLVIFVCIDGRISTGAYFVNCWIIVLYLLNLDFHFWLSLGPVTLHWSIFFFNLQVF